MLEQRQSNAQNARCDAIKPPNGDFLRTTSSSFLQCMPLYVKRHGKHSASWLSNKGFSHRHWRWQGFRQGEQPPSG